MQQTKNQPLIRTIDQIIQMLIFVLLIGVPTGIILTYIGPPFQPEFNGQVVSVYQTDAGSNYAQTVYVVQNGIQVYSYCNAYQVGNTIHYATNLLHSVYRIISPLSGCN